MGKSKINLISQYKAELPIRDYTEIISTIGESNGNLSLQKRVDRDTNICQK